MERPAGTPNFLQFTVCAGSHRVFLRDQANRIHSLRWCERGPLLTRPRTAQPLLNHHETEQELMVILPPRPMVAQKLSDRLALEQIIHKGASIQEQLR